MIELQGVSKSYFLGDHTVPVLKHVSMNVQQGEFIAIMGPSGSGKSSLLNIVGCLDSIDSGRYYLSGTPISHLDSTQLAELRNRHIGFVFQSFNLIPRINAQRNVELPMIYAGIAAEIRQKRALAALSIVGLADWAGHAPSQMSGGQQQRVAIARSIVNSPNIIIADEPTGALDSQTSHDIMRLFQQLNASGKTIIMVTHETEIAAYAQRTIYVQDGKILD